MMKLNKKGFTLVELLAVIVILALLMVVLANTALPAMNNSKKKTFVLYAQRLQAKAQEMHAIDTNMSSTEKTYSVAELMGASAEENYTGAVKVSYDTTNQKYTVIVSTQLKDIKNTQCIAVNTEITANADSSIVGTCS